MQTHEISDWNRSTAFGHQLIHLKSGNAMLNLGKLFTKKTAVLFM